MSEKLRRCLGCRALFRSSSSANRFCKTCKKKRKNHRGGFQDLDMDCMPQTICVQIRQRIETTYDITLRDLKLQTIHDNQAVPDTKNAS